jgi:ABC-type transport system substrate-binding protein
MILRLVLAIVLTLSLTSPLAAQTPKRGGTLVVGMSQDLPGLDPHPSTSTITYQVLSLVYQGLVDFDRDLKIKPVLAESWTTSADGKTWTFKLRKGVKFEATVDAGKRADAYRRFVELLEDEVPVVTTGLGDAAVGWRMPVKGFEPHIIGLLAYPGGGLPNVWLDR